MDIDKIWLCKVYSRTIKINNDIVKTIVYFILPLIVIFIPYLISRFKLILQYDIKTVTALLCAASWSFLGPFLIHRYFLKFNKFETDMKEFMIPLDEIIKDKDNYDNKQGFETIINNEFSNLKRNIVFISITWSFLIVSILIIFRKEMIKYGFYGLEDIYFYVLVIYISFLLHLQAIGFSAIIMSINIIRKIAKEVYIVEDILENNDGYGIKILGDLTVRTTIYFMSGLVYIPILLVFVSNQSDIAKILVSIAIIVFLCFFLASFLIPNYLLWKSAEEQKNIIDNEIRKRYNIKLKSSLEESNYKFNEKLLNELQINNLYNQMQLIEKIRTKPVSLEKIIFVITSLLVPLIFFLNDIYDIYCTVSSVFKNK